MDALTSTVEEYLEKLFWMNEAGIDPTQANLARAVGVSQPTALEMVRRLVDDGFVVRDDRKRLRFTEMRRGVGEPHRHAPSPDRGLPRAGLRHPVGRGARGGALVRARRLREPRGAHARAARRRHDVPSRAPDRRRPARARRPAGDGARRLDRARAAPRERGRGPAPRLQARGHRARRHDRDHRTQRARSSSCRRPRRARPRSASPSRARSPSRSSRAATARSPRPTCRAQLSRCTRPGAARPASG